MNSEFEVYKIQLAAYYERYTRLLLCILELTTKVPKDAHHKKAIDRAIEAADSMCDGVLEMIKATETQMRNSK